MSSSTDWKSQLETHGVPPIILGSAIATALLRDVAQMEPVSISKLPRYHFYRHYATQCVVGRLLAHGLIKSYWNRDRRYLEAPTLLALNRQHPVMSSIIFMLRTMTDSNRQIFQTPPSLDDYFLKPDFGDPIFRTLLGSPKRTLILALVQAVPGIRSNVVAQCIAANDLGRLRPLQSLLRSGIVVTRRPSEFKTHVPRGRNRIFSLNYLENWSSSLNDILNAMISVDPYLQSKCRAALALQGNRAA